MATLSTGKLTLQQLATREDPNGQTAQLVDVISQVNAIIADSMMIECNNGTFHQASRVVSEPSGTERAYNAGVPATVGITEVVTEPTSMIDDRLVMDSAEILHTPNPAQTRMDEETLHLKGMAKQFASRIFDGNRSTSPLQINGINNRSDYNALSSDFVYDNAKGNASATANKSSLYIIQHGLRRFALTHPRNDPGGTNMGLKKRDMGEDMVVDARVSTNSFPAFQTWFELHFGLFIYDPRMIKRIVNISTTNIDGVDDFSWDEEVMFDAVGDLEDNGVGAVIYVNKTIWTQMRKRANEKGNATFTMATEGEGPFAKKVLFFDTIPIHRVDQITNVQATVS